VVFIMERCFDVSYLVCDDIVPIGLYEHIASDDLYLQTIQYMPYRAADVGLCEIHVRTFGDSVKFHLRFEV